MTSADCTGIVPLRCGNAPELLLRVRDGVIEARWGDLSRAPWVPIPNFGDGTPSRGATLRYYQNALATTERAVEELRVANAALQNENAELRGRLAEPRT